MLLTIDTGGRMAGVLAALATDILWVLDNKFLDPRYWKNPGQPGNVHAKYHRVVRLYHDQNWAAILEYILERIAVLRGQIVHGAATRGSKLNRETLSRCRSILEGLLPVVLQLVIEQRVDDDWPPLCYPPIKE